VAQLADALEIDRFAVLGYSCGGKYAAACARALPERVLAAGIVSGIGPPQTPRFREGLNSVDRMSMTLATRARPLAMLYWRIAARMVNQSRDKFLAQLEKEVTDADKAALREPALRATLIDTSREALRSGPAGVVEDFAVQAKPWGFALDEIQVPVRIWHGDQDHLVPLHHSEHAANLIPDAELIVLKGQGHLVLTHFVEVVRTLTGDLARRSPQTL
jgi:pimeloyl-ACP methyl ester carboxylesterase